jgi:hypothetical protein
MLVGGGLSHKTNQLFKTNNLILEAIFLFPQFISFPVKSSKVENFFLKGGKEPGIIFPDSVLVGVKEQSTFCKLASVNLQFFKLNTLIF